MPQTINYKYKFKLIIDKTKTYDHKKDIKLRCVQIKDVSKITSVKMAKKRKICNKITETQNYTEKNNFDSIK